MFIMARAQAPEGDCDLGTTRKFESSDWLITKIAITFEWKRHEVYLELILLNVSLLSVFYTDIGLR